MARSARNASVASLAGWLAGWLLPVAILLTQGGLYADIAWFFSKMAIVTFGGAYAVLAYVSL
jgi:chromate transporter